MECFGGMGDLDGEAEANLTTDDLLQLLGRQAIKQTTEDIEHEHDESERRICEHSEFETNGMLIGGEVPNDDTPFIDKTVDHNITADDSYNTDKDVDNTLTGVSMPVIVKEEPLNEYSVMQAILGLNHSLAPADSSSISCEEEPRGRPRGPKHPVWTFFKLRRTQGPTNGYMCELCGGYFIGAANTTNAAKHLKCRHKSEYALYAEMHESAKRGTFVGDLHAQLREIMKRGRARRLSNLGGITLPHMNTMKDEFEEPTKEREECSLFERDSTSPRPYVNPLDSMFSLTDLRNHATPSTSTNLKAQCTLPALVPQLCALVPETPIRSNAHTDDSAHERSPKKPRLDTPPETNGDSSQTIADQMQSFVQGFRKLENECKSLRFQLLARDEQIASLRLQVLRERNKRENALLVIRQALLDNNSVD